MPNIRWLLALITATHRFVYRASGGWLGHRLTPSKTTLLLSVVGRRSGETRVVPLLYVESGGRYVVVGSNAGDDRPPAWWLNLQANPRAHVQVGRRHLEVRARQAGPDEAKKLWPELEASYGSYRAYRQRTEREIPLVLLEVV